MTPTATTEVPGGTGEGACLTVDGLTRRFGGFTALDGLSLTVDAGSVVGLVGPNGSGKTTLINVASGVYRPSSGRVLLDGREITGLAPHRLVALGLNRTFQVPKPLGSLTVAENIEVAARHSHRGGPDRRSLLADVGLGSLGDRPGASLNASQQKRLDLARALATNPSVLLVDELGAGLDPDELADLAAFLRSLAASGIALVVVEHLLGFLEQLADRVVVLSAGREIFSGPLAGAIADPDVIRVFLGG
ncbi:MAG: ABC transporter ATP-binding protein [Streptosporangiaceae bacterium]